MIGVGDAHNLCIRKFAMNAIYKYAQLASINEQGLAATVCELTIPLCLCKEPEASRNLRAIEQLWRQGDHRVYEIGLDQALADFALARLIGRHGAVRQNKAGNSG